MTGPDHCRKAEEILAGLEGIRSPASVTVQARALHALAHATLALADAAKAGTIQIRGGHEDPPLLYGFDQEPGPGPDR